MDEREKKRIGEQIEPGGRPRAPGRLELLQRFINSHNHDFPPEGDRLGTTEKATTWLRDKRLLGPRDRVADADVARLRELREALRELVVANQAGRPAGGKIPERAELTVVIDGLGRTALEPTRPGVDGAM